MSKMFLTNELLIKFAFEGKDATCDSEEYFGCYGCDYTCDDFGENFIDKPILIQK